MGKNKKKTPSRPAPKPPPPPPVQSCKQCTITSETVATSPANRARTRIGVGEKVTLTVSPEGATWVITKGGGALEQHESEPFVTFTASDIQETVEVTATGSGCSCTSTFIVVEPSDWTTKRQAGTKLGHEKMRPQVSWLGIAYVHPNDVNFGRVEWRELDAIYVGTGSSSYANGEYHGEYPLDYTSSPPVAASQWRALDSHTEADGSTDSRRDMIDSGHPSVEATGAAPPFKKGSGYFPIKMQWRVVGTTTIHTMPEANQEDEVFADGRCESCKGGNTEHTMWNDPESPDPWESESKP